MKLTVPLQLLNAQLHVRGFVKSWTRSTTGESGHTHLTGQLLWVVVAPVVSRRALVAAMILLLITGRLRCHWKTMTRSCDN